MLVAERRASIIKKLETHGSVRVADLSIQFGVTEETIRRDLEELEKQKILKRTYGGAVKATGTSFELPFAKRRDKNAQEKTKMARAAARLISEGDTVSFDASTTVLRLCEEVQHLGRLTVLTNSVQVLIELAGWPDIHVIGTGGSIRDTALSFVGPLAERAIENHHVDKTFISCKGVSVTKGVTDSNELEVELKKKMVQSAQEVIVMADHTKFDYVGFARIADVGQVDTVITDDAVPAEQIRSLEKAGVRVIVADDSN